MGELDSLIDVHLQKVNSKNFTGKLSITVWPSTDFGKLAEILNEMEYQELVIYSHLDLYELYSL